LPVLVPFIATALARTSSGVWSTWRLVSLFVFWYFDRSTNAESNLYSIFIALVFGFSTLNILALVTRRYEARYRNFSFGETLALTAMILSVILLSWELLHLYHVFPIKLQHY
jgi:hypothetical protein